MSTDVMSPGSPSAGTAPTGLPVDGSTAPPPSPVTAGRSRAQIVRVALAALAVCALLAVAFVLGRTSVGTAARAPAVAPATSSTTAVAPATSSPTGGAPVTSLDCHVPGPPC
ncbi:MAG: hypothetical protein ACXWBN_07350 [Acidimicrobiales bacterium]